MTLTLAFAMRLRLYDMVITELKIVTLPKRRIWIPAILLVALTAYVALVVIGNRTYRTIELEALGSEPTRTQQDNSLSVTAWNLGYGGLGAESDFVTDGGANLLPPSREIVDKNIQGIVSGLTSLKSDVILIQEAARPSFMTHGADTLGAVNTELAGRDNVFSADFTVRFTPSHWSPQHGLFTSIDLSGATREIVRLPLEPGYLMGLSRRLYHLQVVRLPFPDGEWSLINVHLSAFDDGANVRLAQLRAVLDFAEEEYAKGRYVVIGGDWNLELAQPGRSHTTKQEDLFWLFPFPKEELGKGWRIAADAKVPSVRTNERPYQRGENFTTTIDGFVVSPNVEIESIEGIDLDFQYTDHQPVTVQLRAVGQ